MKVPGWMFVAASAIGAFGAQPSYAEYISATTGSARLGSEHSCFQFDYGRVSNPSCDGVRMFTVAAPHVTGQRYFEVYGANAWGLFGNWCEALVLDASGWPIWGSGRITLANGSATTSLGNRYVNNGETILFECGIEDAAHWASSISRFRY